jgi:hypothetical protein
VRQKTFKFKTSLGYITNPYFKKKERKINYRKEEWVHMGGENVPIEDDACVKV